jgi:hypothetical protein
VEDSKALFFFSKFPWAWQNNSVNFVENLGMRPQKGSPALTYIFVNIPGGTTKIAKIKKQM